ncbi:MAG: glutathione S-transferase family protein [Legionellaceae bacterium]|nr:glutathione S-transferase family protein [Legionellaceae bacterium]
MGMLVEGQWQDVWYDTHRSGGRFVRSKSQFRNWITPDGSPGPSGEGGFKAESGRYHLYASYACPWVHRTLIYRKLKGLESMVDVSFVHWLMDKDGWTFEKDHENIVGDQLFQFDYAHQIYTQADPEYTGRVTVPILWDTKKNTIVSNESSEIIRMFNSAFDALGATPGDYYPPEKQAEIDTLNHMIYEKINNGVYKCGFATTQAAYEEAITPLFEALDALEVRLADQAFLCGDAPLEADWRLFPTLFRFDAIYVGHFKCSKKRIQDYPNLKRYAKALYAWPGISQTAHMVHAKRHYYESHITINPSRIVPMDDETSWTHEIS